MIFFTKREQICILILIVLVLLISFFTVFRKNKDSNSDVVSQELSSNIIDNNGEKLYDNEEKEDSSGMIMVHISGHVDKPGIVELEEGSRTIDAVNKAGGLKEDVDLDKINLAKKLEDEEKIYIPKIGEELEEDWDNTSNFSSNNDKININTASKEELMTLPGIGEVLADRIIQYREENKFNSIEDIQNVSGIGPKKFEGIEELIDIK